MNTLQSKKYGCWLEWWSVLWLYQVISGRVWRIPHMEPLTVMFNRPLLMQMHTVYIQNIPTTSNSSYIWNALYIYIHCMYITHKDVSDRVHSKQIHTFTYDHIQYVYIAPQKTEKRSQAVPDNMYIYIYIYSSYFQGSPRVYFGVAMDVYIYTINIIYIYVCVCM